MVHVPFHPPERGHYRWFGLGIVAVDLVDGLRAPTGRWQILSQACLCARGDADAAGVKA